MDTLPVIFSGIAPIFLIVAAGAAARRLRWLTAEADRSLMTVVVNILYPCLIFSFVLNNPALKDPANLVLPPLLGFVTVTGGFAIAMFAARALKLGDETECRTFAFAAGIQNYGYFPIPLVAMLFGRETNGVLLVHNVGVEVALWSVGVAFILGAGGDRPAWRRILSPPVVAILAAVPMNLLGLDARLPEFLLEGIDMLAACAIPLGVLLTGATFSDLAPELSPRTRAAIPLAACALRLGLYPALFLLVAKLFPFSVELKQVLVVQAAMPCAVLPIVLARHYEGAPAIALKAILFTTAASLATIPLWISLGLAIFGF